MGAESELEPTLGVDGTEGPPVATARLPDRYEDLGRIATGGFGEVRRVRDQHLGCVLAMKILRWEAAEDPEQRRRFHAEARLTSQLKHPGIVAVQDLGELEDGRSWFTMEIVRGRTLTDVIGALHAGDEAWTLRRVVDALVSACQAVAAAHVDGVVHRDLKPDNVMVGAFGEVRVMDWGLARLVAAIDDETTDSFRDVAADQTAVGRVMGTPAFMPPEQARGEPIGPTADVYALGAMLYRVLTGRSPYLGDGRTAWLGVLAGPPPDVRTTPLLPEELCAICDRAMARDPADRFPHAAALADALAAWLEGARKLQEAQALVEAVRARVPEAAALRARAVTLDEEARRALDGVAPSAPVEQKIGGWRLEEEAKAARSEARRVEAELVRDLRAALTGAPDLPAAHDTLADLYRERLEDAESRGDLDAVAEHELALRTHDRGRHSAWLAGNGAVTLVTDPPGARVEVYRYEERDRRLVEVPAGELGVTPLHAVPLPRGSYLLVLTLPGHAPVRYPVQVGRLEHWEGIRPGDAAPHPIWLPRVGELGPDDCYVPAGWFVSGGDPNALDGLPRRRLWVDGLRARRHPVTNAEYIAFLDDVREERWCPRDTIKNALLFQRDGEGRYHLPEKPVGDQDPGVPDEPVCFVDVASARAFAEWETKRTGVEWRLPHDQEWEKAARGVDARAFPWGDQLDPSWACMQLSHVGVPKRAVVSAYPGDESPYGVRGMGGNVRDWCANGYSRGGFTAGSALVPHDDSGMDSTHCMVRGGSISNTALGCRVAVRGAWNPSNRGAMVGFRLVSSVS